MLYAVCSMFQQNKNSATKNETTVEMEWEKQNKLIDYDLDK